MKDAQTLSADDIFWVIAIPFTWGHQYRDFIRKAAEESYHNMVIVLESEAAFMYVRNKPVCFKQEKIEPFKAGQFYMLVDIGAGTSDICTHKVLPDGNLIEICSSLGINEGGERINTKFFNIFNELFTKKVMDTFRLESIRLYKLEKEFEDHKHTFKSDTDKDFVLLLDETLLTMYTKKHAKNC
ncbi:hypothetical protein DPMN_166331 [Dreissena polymorpha]|uniref:Heat shock protein 70 n=1 Tax=Dreissena polymorpha TaxID=45954 RepID=A0A9D4EYF7_DREPO|nr:hypothetical protein DPMN_166331 [Dreissena polymorpha]